MRQDLLKICVLGVLTFVLLLSNIGVSSASDIPIVVYQTGGIELSLNGAFDTGLVFPNVIPMFDQDQTTTWNESESTDYISFVDDTEIPGFEISLSSTNFIYTGSSQTQGPLPAANMVFYGEYDNDTPSAATKGLDDYTKTLSILPESCGSVTTDNFTFSPDLTGSGTNYGLASSTNEQTILTSTADCAVIGKIRFDKVKLLFPALSAEGSYSASFTLTISDGY